MCMHVDSRSHSAFRWENSFGNLTKTNSECPVNLNNSTKCYRSMGRRSLKTERQTTSNIYKDNMLTNACMSSTALQLRSTLISRQIL
jgi:hypothetical protein